MRIVKTDTLKPGDMLGKSLFNRKGELLLATGYELDAEMITRVRESGFRHVYLWDEATRDIKPEEVISDTTRQLTHVVVADLVHELENAAEDLKKYDPVDIQRQLEMDDRFKRMIKLDAVRKQVVQILEEIIEQQITMFTSLPMKSQSGHEYEHALDVAILSILVAREFNYEYRELKAIALAALVHDLGKQIFTDLKNKKENELNPEEKMILREHPVYSMLLLQNVAPGAYQEHTAVLQHHEQINGRGYPQGMRGTTGKPIQTANHDKGMIHRYALILGPVNAYDNLLSGTIDGKYLSPAEALTKVLDGSTGAWNPFVIKAMSRIIQCYPVGATVRILNNYTKTYIGYTGVIAECNTKEYQKPVVILTNNASGRAIPPRRHDFSRELFMDLELVL